jgi:3-hydroxyacyl-[acyl-carrier-protein] dehydratase
MRYLFIDRIQELEVNKSILASKNIALSEDIFADHFLGFPVMPGALLIECLAQAGTALLEVSSNHKKKAILAIVEQAKFRQFVCPGDQLSIFLNIVSSDDNVAQLDGTIRVKDVLTVNARLTFTLQDPSQIYTAKTRYFIESLYEFWLRDAKVIGLSESGGKNHD